MNRLSTELGAVIQVIVEDYELWLYSINVVSQLTRLRYEASQNFRNEYSIQSKRKLKQKFAYSKI